MKHLYKNSQTYNEFNKSLNFEIEVIEPWLFKAYEGQVINIKTIIFNIYWYLLTRGGYKVYLVKDLGKIVHISYVIPKCFKFTFLENNAVEAGPCITSKEYRGRGIYPYVLNKILKSHKDVYMIVDDSNVASINGIKKVGFKKIDGYIERDMFLRYIHRR